jgi:hypothetical protein
VEVEAVTDPLLYKELKANGPQLAAIAQTVSQLRSAAGFIAQQTVGDFNAIDAGGDLVRACIARGNVAVTQAQSTLASLAQADVTVFH